MPGRGIDFEQRFKPSRWAEDLLIESLGARYGLLAKRFGLSEVRPSDKLVYGLTSYKEPDLLVFRAADLSDDEKKKLESTNLDSTDREAFYGQADLSFAFPKAAAGVEVEFSPYRASEMTGRHWNLRSDDQWQKRPLKRAIPPIAPNIFVKEEDLPKLLEWERTTTVPIVIVHLFDQEAFAVSLKMISEFNARFENGTENRIQLQVTTGIFKLLQSYDRTDAQGAGEKKMVFRVAPAAAIKVGDVTGVTVSAQLGLSTSKKYVTQPVFSGGKIEITNEFLALLNSLPRRLPYA